MAKAPLFIQFWPIHMPPLLTRLLLQPSKYSILLSFSLNTEVILSHNFLFGHFKKWKFSSRKLCLKKNQTCRLVILFHTNTASLAIKTPSCGHSGWKKGRIGSKRQQNLKLLGGHTKTFYKVVAAVCFWTHWNKWHSWFQKWKNEINFSKREILIKISENSLFL